MKKTSVKYPYLTEEVEIYERENKHKIVLESRALVARMGIRKGFHNYHINHRQYLNLNHEDLKFHVQSSFFYSIML